MKDDPVVPSLQHYNTWILPLTCLQVSSSLAEARSWCPAMLPKPCCGATNLMCRTSLQRYPCWLVVWNMFYFSIYWECNHPNWLIFFNRVETTNQHGFGLSDPSSLSPFEWLENQMVSWEVSSWSSMPLNEPFSVHFTSKHFEVQILKVDVLCHALPSMSKHSRIMAGARHDSTSCPACMQFPQQKANQLIFDHIETHHKPPLVPPVIRILLGISGS